MFLLVLLKSGHRLHVMNLVFTHENKQKVPSSAPPRHYKNILCSETIFSSLPIKYAQTYSHLNWSTQFIKPASFQCCYIYTTKTIKQSYGHHNINKYLILFTVFMFLLAALFKTSIFTPQLLPANLLRIRRNLFKASKKYPYVAMFLPTFKINLINRMASQCFILFQMERSWLLLRWFNDCVSSADLTYCWSGYIK